MKQTRTRRTRGHALLEFTVGSGLLVALFTGAYQFGYTFYSYENLMSAVRCGARFGAMRPYDVGAPTTDSMPSSMFTTAVRNVTVYGDPNGAASGAQPVVPGLDTSHVMVTVAFRNAVPATVTVSVHGYMLETSFRSWRANRKPQVTFQYMGRYDPPMP